MSRGLNKLAVFNEKRERTRLLNLMRENLQNYDVEIYAYCIMPNHFHLLIKAPNHKNRNIPLKLKDVEKTAMEHSITL